MNAVTNCWLLKKVSTAVSEFAPKQSYLQKIIMRLFCRNLNRESHNTACDMHLRTMFLCVRVRKNWRNSVVSEA